MLGGMNTTSRVLIFGVVSGLVWSLVPGLLSELFESPGETATVLGSGAITGVVISLALRPLLAKFGRGGALGFGVLSLPVGAFIFGVIISLIQFAIKALVGISYRFADGGGHPILAGLGYAFMSVLSIFAVVLLLLAVLSTFCLRALIVRGVRDKSAA
jgi:hypothetical protein